LPPIDEQLRINRQLDAELSDVNVAISRLEREIELLREYRIRLVADVVTGKLDVREAAKGLPEESAEPEPAPDVEELVEPEEGET
jgi:type I restriction enzyme S subunit